MKSVLIAAATAAAASIIMGCASRPSLHQEYVPPPVGQSRSLSSDTVSVLTFNVENLFDTEHDEGKSDETFLPAATKEDPVVANNCRIKATSAYREEECLEKNWNDRVLARKFSRLAHVLAQINNGLGPDILILQEVENRHVLEMWRERELKRMGYNTLSHVEGPDERGIDTAVLSRLAMVKPPVLHEIDFSKEPQIAETDRRPTRGILETHLQLPTGETVAVFSLHFPSQGASTLHRKVALDKLLEVTAPVRTQMPVIVGGDFNITSKEEWKNKYFKDILAKEFVVSHLVGCHKCPGTTYYPKDKTWSFFDVLLFSKPLAQGDGNWKLDPQSIRVANDSVYQINRFGTPARFGSGYGSVGVSDHWPMYAEIRLKPKSKDVQ